MRWTGKDNCVSFYTRTKYLRSYDGFKGCSETTNWIYRALHWKKQLLQVVGFGSIQSESSREKGAGAGGSVQGLTIKPGWSLPGWWTVGYRVTAPAAGFKITLDQPPCTSQLPNLLNEDDDTSEIHSGSKVGLQLRKHFGKENGIPNAKGVPIFLGQMISQARSRRLRWSQLSVITHFMG